MSSMRVAGVKLAEMRPILSGSQYAKHGHQPLTCAGRAPYHRDLRRRHGEMLSSSLVAEFQASLVSYDLL